MHLPIPVIVKCMQSFLHENYRDWRESTNEVAHQTQTYKKKSKLKNTYKNGYQFSIGTPHSL